MTGGGLLTEHAKEDFSTNGQAPIQHWIRRFPGRISGRKAGAAQAGRGEFGHVLVRAEEKRKKGIDRNDGLG